MSMQSSAGAEAATNEVLDLIKRLRQENLSDSEILIRVIKNLEEINQAGKTGWY